jgi:hypothetical protein
MEMLSVELFKNSSNLSEIYQWTGFKFAFFSNEEKPRQCHVWVKCRDFLHDAVRGFLMEKQFPIYGFLYDKKSMPPIDVKKMRMLVQPSVKGEEALAQMESALRIINTFERAAKKKPLTKLFKVNDTDNVFAFVGSKPWIDSPFTISLFTFLIRLGFRKLQFANKEELMTALERTSNEERKRGDNDISYLKTTLPYLFAILPRHKDLKFQRDDGTFLMGDQNIDVFHNYGGIVSLCSGQIHDSKIREVYKEIVDPKT